MDRRVHYSNRYVETHHGHRTHAALCGASEGGRSRFYYVTPPMFAGGRRLGDRPLDYTPCVACIKLEYVMLLEEL